MPAMGSRLGLYVAMSLAAGGVIAVMAGFLYDGLGRGRAPEPVLRAFLAAAQDSREEHALSYLHPDTRSRWEPFVHQYLVGNRYQIVGIGVPSVPILQRLIGTPADTEVLVTLTLDVSNDIGETWRVTTTSRLQRAGSRWLIVDPPLVPAEGPPT